MNLEIKEIPDSKLHHFVNFPYRMFARDPYWTGEFIKDTTHLLSTSHPFWNHGERKLFLAWRDGQITGRIAAIINRAHNSFHNDNCGFYGFFDCENRKETAAALFEAAESWLKKKGFDNIIGPVNPSTNETCGTLIDSFNMPPMIMMPYNPPYYAELTEAAGYTKAKDLFAFRIDPNAGLPAKYQKLLDRIVKRNEGLRIQKVDIKNIDTEISRLKSIYNEAWEKNWGFVPMTSEEFDELARSVKQVLKPELLYFAMYGNEPAGFVLILPNLNPALKTANGKLNIFNIFRFLMAMRKTDSGRMLTLGVKKEYRNRGLELLLIKQAMVSASELGWKWGEMSWTLEDNDLINNTIYAVGGEKYKTYRLYSKKL